MVKLLAPGLALSAAGGLAKTITFANSPRGTYAKLWHKPSQPQTSPQVAMRAILKFLSNQWSIISPADQATWNAIAEAQNIAPINAYQQINLERWRRFAAPSQQYPATETGALQTWVAPLTVPISRGVRTYWTTTNAGDDWGVTIFRTPTAPTSQAWLYLRHVEPVTGNGPYEWIDRPVPPGTYYYKFSEFTTAGRRWTGAVSRTVVVV